MKAGCRVIIIACLALATGLAGGAQAGDATVLPKGVWSVVVEGTTYLPIKERFNKDGKTESAAKDFNATLDSGIFPDLSAIETAFGMPPGSGNIGRSVVGFKYQETKVELTIGRGITDRLTVGLILPYLWWENRVDAFLDSTNATLGKNPFFGTPTDPFGGAPLVPVALGGQPLTTEDAQALISSGLDINGARAIDGLGFKRIETWTADGWGDIQGGAKYQFFRTDDWRLAFTAGVQLPTGKVDDPNNLVDRGFGTGAAALIFLSNNDYTGIRGLVLDGTVKYSLYLPHSVNLRVVSDPHKPLTGRVEKVDRDLGDILELEGSASYEFLEGACASVLYRFGRGFRDKVTGPGGRIPSLEAETDYTEQVVVAGLSYSTVPRFLRKSFPIPLTVFGTYRNRFYGTNSIFKSEYVNLGVQVYF